VQRALRGTSDENAALVSAVIGGAQRAQATAAEESITSLPLTRPSRHMRLTFFPPDAGTDKPDYDLGLRRLLNGVSRDMVLDYGEFAIKAELDENEVAPKPNC
jgi:hypothetical protein